LFLAIARARARIRVRPDSRRSQHRYEAVVREL
jgi:hypothetical protein